MSSLTAPTKPSPWHGPFTSAEEAQGFIACQPDLLPPFEIKIQMASAPLRIRVVDNVEEVSGFTRHRPGFLRGQIPAEEKSDQEILEELSDENIRHMIHKETLMDIINWIFKFQDILPNGVTKSEVDSMTRFQQVEFLERLSSEYANTNVLGNTPVRINEIDQLIHEIDKKGLRTAEDFQRK